MLLRIQGLRIDAMQLRARLALASAFGDERERRLRLAEKLAAKIERENMAYANPRINLARAHGISKHRVGVGRGFRNRLQHVPVLQDSAIRIEPENVHAGVLFAAPIQIAHMNEGQIAFNGHTLDLTGNTARLPEVAFQRCCPVWKERIVLDVCTGDQVGQQVGFALVEHFPVEGIERSSNLFLSGA